MVTAIALTACGGSSSSSSAPHPNGVLNTKRVAVAIQHSIFSERHLNARVSCPAHVVQEQGVTFTCTATSHSHHKLLRAKFTVFQRTSTGKVYYQSP